MLQVHYALYYIVVFHLFRFSDSLQVQVRTQPAIFCLQKDGDAFTEHAPLPPLTAHPRRADHRPKVRF